MPNQECAAENGRMFKREGWRIVQEPQEMRLCLCKAEYPANHLVIKGELDITVRLIHGSQVDQGHDLLIATLRIFVEECGNEIDVPRDYLAIQRNFDVLSSLRFWLCHTEQQIIGLLFHNRHGHLNDRNVMRVLLDLADQTKEFDGRISKDMEKRRELLDTFRQASAERC